jgi:hypothetical protein
VAGTDDRRRLAFDEEPEGIAIAAEDGRRDALVGERSIRRRWFGRG